jgi:hypothetical protein
MIRSAQDVIAIAKARGFDLAIRPGPPPMPVLTHCGGDRQAAQATPVLMEALKAWRVEIMDLLREKTNDSV